MRTRSIPENIGVARARLDVLLLQAQAPLDVNLRGTDKRRNLRGRIRFTGKLRDEFPLRGVEQFMTLLTLLVLVLGYEPTFDKNLPWWNPDNWHWQAIMIVAAIVTSGAAYILHQQIQEDLKVLLAVIRASDPSVTVSTTVDTI